MNLEAEVKLLADRAEELIKTLKRLQADNHQLRLQQDQVSAEKVDLQDRNRQAKQRIVVIVERLRMLESVCRRRYLRALSENLLWLKKR